MTNKTKYKLLVIAVLFLLLAVLLAAGFNTKLQTTEYSYKNPKIPPEFDGYRIAHISDYHNYDFGNRQASFIAAVAAAQPDIIVLTGDIVDEDHPDIVAAQQMIEGIVTIAPVYYITGNHELKPESSMQYGHFMKVLEQNGVVHLDDSAVQLQKGKEHITLSGQMYRSHYITSFLPPANQSMFNILLYHGSDNFNLIAPFGYDLVFAGHTHGGLIRLPFVGGLINNEGGLFPKYDGGVFRNGNATLVSSRGIGEAGFPRFYNRSELVVVTLNRT